MAKPSELWLWLELRSEQRAQGKAYSTLHDVAHLRRGLPTGECCSIRVQRKDYRLKPILLCIAAMSGDAWIVASAVAYELPLYTRDRDFLALPVKGLEVISFPD